MRYLNGCITIQFIIGNLESMQSMSDRFDVSKGSFHKNIKRTASVLCKIMPDTIKWPSNAIQVDKTCRLFAERSQFQNILGEFSPGIFQPKRVLFYCFWHTVMPL